MKSFHEKMGGTYRREGDYYLPNLIVPESPVLGIWGQRRRRYLMEHRNPIYIGMLLAGTLNDHLTEIDRNAEVMFSQMVTQFAAADQVNEALKASDQMEWVRCMNNIRNRAAEIVNARNVSAHRRWWYRI